MLMVTIILCVHWPDASVVCFVNWAMSNPNKMLKKNESKQTYRKQRGGGGVYSNKIVKMKKYSHPAPHRQHLLCAMKSAWSNVSIGAVVRAPAVT